MPPSATAIAQVLDPVFQRTPTVQAAYLFGSLADGSAGEQSDIDIGVVAEDGTRNRLGLRESVELELELGTALGNHNVDLVVLNRAPLPLQHRVVATGTVLFSRDESKRMDFVEQVAREYIDVQPWLRRAQREYLETVREQYGSPPNTQPAERT